MRNQKFSALQRKCLAVVLLAPIIGMPRFLALLAWSQQGFVRSEKIYHLLDEKVGATFCGGGTTATSMVVELPTWRLCGEVFFCCHWKFVIVLPLSNIVLHSSTQDYYCSSIAQWGNLPQTDSFALANASKPYIKPRVSNKFPSLLGHSDLHYHIRNMILLYSYMAIGHH